MNSDEGGQRFPNIRSGRIGSDEILPVGDVMKVEVDAPVACLIAECGIHYHIGRDRIDVGDIAITLQWFVVDQTRSPADIEALSSGFLLKLLWTSQ